MTFKPGEGLYAELGDDGKLKETIYTKDPGISKDVFVDTGYDLTKEEKSNIESGQPITPTKSRKRRRTTRSTPSTTTTQQKETTSPAPVKAEEPKQPTYTETKTEDGYRFTAPYIGDVSRLSNETQSQYETRIRKQVETDAIRSAQRFASERPGERVEVEYTYNESFTSPAFTSLNQERISPVQESPTVNFWGKREPGRETISDAPTYTYEAPKPSIGTSTEEKRVLAVGRIINPKKFNDDTTQEELTKTVSNIKETTPLKPLYDLGVKTSNFFKSMPSKFEESQTPGLTATNLNKLFRSTPGLAAITPAEVSESSKASVDAFERQGVRVVSTTGDVFVSDTLKDPGSAGLMFLGGAGLGAASKSVNVGSKTVTSIAIGTTVVAGADIALSDDPLRRGVEVSKDFALVGAGFKFGTTVRSDFRTTMGDLWYREPGFVLSSAEARIQRPGVQTTVQGGYVSDYALEGFKPVAKLPDSYYANLKPSTESVKLNLRPRGVDPKTGDILFDAKNIRSGSNVRLDDGVSALQFGTTESGQTVLTSARNVGVRTTPLSEPTVRLIDAKVGKEYNVPSSFVQRRLAENPNLQVVQTTNQQKLLFSADPISAIAFEFSTPSFKPITSTPSSGVPRSSPSVVSESVFSTKNFNVPAISFTPKFNFGSTSSVVNVSESSFLPKSEVREKSVVGVGFIPSVDVGTVEVVKPVSDVVSRTGSRTRNVVVPGLVPVTPVTDTPQTFVPVTPVTGTPKPIRGRVPPFVPPRVPSINLDFGRSKGGFKPQTPSKGFFGAWKTASAGRAFLTQPVRTLRLGGVVSERPRRSKKKEDLFGGFSLGLFAQKRGKF